MKTWLILFLAMFLCAGCEAQRTYLKPALDEQGEVSVYLRTFPREAAPLKFTLNSVSAVKDDGSEYPLAVAFNDMSPDTVKRQRAFATGELPPGNYTALSFGVERATLQDEDGEQQLLVPEKPTRIDCRFSVARKRASFVSLAFRYDLSVKKGFSFTPVFSATIPGKPVPGVVGYVSNYLSNTLTVFDKQALEVVGTIATGAGPTGIALDQVRRRAYVALAGDDAVDVIDTVLGEIIYRIRLKPGDNPQELALSSDGKTLLTANLGTNTVSVMDPVAYLEVGRVQVGDGPLSIALDPTGVRAYVLNSLSRNVSVIDIGSRTVVATVSSEPGLTRWEFNKSGNTIYAAHELSSYIQLINPSTLSVIKSYRVGMGITALKTDPMTNLIYAGRRLVPSIDVYEPTTFVPLANIATGSGVVNMTIDPTQNYLYAVAAGTKSVAVVNLVTREVVAEFDVGEGPAWVTLMGEGK